MNLSDFPHRRRNPLTGEWTLVSCHRTKRPWQGKPELPPSKPIPEYDPKCALCPGNVRACNQKNPDYDTTFVFDNDFPSLLPDIPVESMDEKGLLVAAGEQGRCRVVCYSPSHNMTLSVMSRQDARGLVDVWENEFRELSATPGAGYVSIFENKGDLLGAFNHHPHCQIWAHTTIPDLPLLETERQKEYLDAHEACLLCTYAAMETVMKSRIVVENDACVAVVPFWASWPYEVLVVPKQHAADISDLSAEGRAAFADILQAVAVRYDNLHSSPFPYALAVHQRPIGASAAGGSREEWHLHAHFAPPMARNGTSRKFMAAFELLYMDRRDNAPEETARKLRSCSDVHYTHRNQQAGESARANDPATITGA